MTVWRKGMLAVCVDGNMQAEEGCTGPIPAKGDVWLVNDVLQLPTGLALRFCEANQDEAFDHYHFRPAVNDDKSADEQFKTELYDIINGRVPAEMKL